MSVDRLLKTTSSRKAKRPPRRKGNSPRLSEDMILDCLTVEISGENIGAIQSGAIMAIVNAFDRRIDRSYFIMLCDAAMTLHGAMGRMHTLLSTKRLEIDKELDGEKIDTAITSITQHASQKQLQLKEMMALVAQCPKEQDTIS